MQVQKLASSWFGLLGMIAVVAILARYPRVITAAFGGFGTSSEKIIKAGL